VTPPKTAIDAATIGAFAMVLVINITSSLRLHGSSAILVHRQAFDRNEPGAQQLKARSATRAVNRSSVSCCRQDSVPRNAMRSAAPTTGGIFVSGPFPRRLMPSASARQNATARGIEPTAIGSRYTTTSDQRARVRPRVTPQSHASRSGSWKYAGVHSLGPILGRSGSCLSWRQTFTVCT
jgi:hypothetical protein